MSKFGSRRLWMGALMFGVSALFVTGAWLCSLHYRSPTLRGLRCKQDLFCIWQAKILWCKAQPASAFPIDPSTALSTEDLEPYLPNKRVLKCPCGGNYIIGVLGDPPACTYTGTYWYKGRTWRHGLTYLPDKDLWVAAVLLVPTNPASTNMLSANW